MLFEMGDKRIVHKYIINKFQNHKFSANVAMTQLPSLNFRFLSHHLHFLHKQMLQTISSLNQNSHPTWSQLAHRISAACSDSCFVFVPVKLPFRIRRLESKQKAFVCGTNCDPLLIIRYLHCSLFWMKVDSRVQYTRHNINTKLGMIEHQLQNSVESLVKRYTDTTSEGIEKKVIELHFKQYSKSGAWWCFIVSLETSLPLTFSERCDVVQGSKSSRVKLCRSNLLLCGLVRTSAWTHNGDNYLHFNVFPPSV